MRDRQLQEVQAEPESRIFVNPELRDPSLPEPTLDRSVQDRIGSELRAMYTGLANQPVPQRFLELIEKLGSKAEDDENGG